MKVIGLAGFSGGELKQLADVSVHAGVNDYGMAENVHPMFGHLTTKYLIDRI